MLIIVGVIVVFGCVAGGFAMHHGPFGVLWQPSEFVIIGGAALGSMIIMAPGHVLKEILHGLIGLLKGKSGGKAQMLGLLATLFHLVKVGSYQGSNGLEPHVENPESSDIISKNHDLVHDHHVIEFLCDTLKVIIIGGVPEHQIAELTDMSLDVHSEEAHHPPAVLTKIADSLPGMGIVAAVLGIIITMQHIDGEPAEIGHSVAAALVGTFLGILMAYGVIGPLASKLEFASHETHFKLNAVRGCVLAYARGLHPLLCAEFGRRALPSHLRPSFSELEAACRDGASVEAA
ncbi:MAG: flagellar motor stator protein MotA [Vulcanimicrobiota bacterium]